MARFRSLLLWLLVGLLVAQPAGAYELLRIGSSTSIKNSGFTDYLFPHFISRSGYVIKLHAVGSGSALRYARTGMVDVVLTHSAEAEKRFVEEGHGLERLALMHNHFVIVGPTDDPAGISGMKDATAAFRKLAGSGANFFSRGDDSGTHRMEMQVWRAAGIDPYGRDWYLETGTAIADTLRTASDLQGYTLVDTGTWLAMRKQVELSLLVEDRERLKNPYHLIAVNPVLHPGVNHQAANAFIAWMRSPEVQEMIRQFKVNGTPLYVPDTMD